MDAQIPRHRKIRKELLELIKSSNGKMERIPPERELCTRYKVSRPTVRHAIDSLVEDGILIPKRGMGTFVNRKIFNKHQVKITNETTIGIVLFGGDGASHLNEYAWSILEKTVNTLSQSGVKILFLSIENTGLLMTEEVLVQDISGIIWFFPDEKNITNILELEENNIPVLCVNRKFKNKRIRYLLVDQQLGGYLAAKHLLEQGHREILFIGYREDNVFTKQRYLGFLKACLEYDVIHDHKLLPQEVGHIYSDTRKMIKSDLSFTAVFIAYGVLTNSVVNAIRDENKAIPDAYSVISYEVNTVDTFPDFYFTAIQQPMNEMGSRAARNILQILEQNNGLPVNEILKPKLVLGESVLLIADN